ncbi:oxidoreductase [Massilia sp. LC238]|uniref:oxidoreductase n=1 Tax=Massilia sp. LC238 TaxID=1502852 RepID=UPI0004E30C68|nr:oxidoreductase [Massilia sp. LC238]KFC69467.1 Short-chain dehydrogenase/reductase SDR [Massilia sp. LC238]
MIPLDNKTFLVAGAAGLIGRTIVTTLLEAGAKVCALDINLDTLRTLEINPDHADRLMMHELDITRREKVQEAFAAVNARFGEIHGAVNAAYPRNKNYGRHFYDVEFSDFHENAGLHLGAYFIFMQQCALYSETRQQRFSLVNLSSIYGVIAPKFEIYEGTTMTMPVEYAAIKSGLQLMTSYASAYTGEYFRANCVSPGGIIAGQNPAFIEKYRENCLSKGVLDAQDVVGTIAFLLSDHSRYVVGQNIVVDDGFTL